jgi:hypothetical protein
LSIKFFTIHKVLGGASQLPSHLFVLTNLRSSNLDALGVCHHLLDISPVRSLRRLLRTLSRIADQVEGLKLCLLVVVKVILRSTSVVIEEVLNSL